MKVTNYQNALDYVNTPEQIEHQRRLLQQWKPSATLVDCSQDMQAQMRGYDWLVIEDGETYCVDAKYVMADQQKFWINKTDPEFIIERKFRYPSRSNTWFNAWAAEPKDGTHYLYVFDGYHAVPGIVLDAKVLQQLVGTLTVPADPSYDKILCKRDLPARNNKGMEARFDVAPMSLLYHAPALHCFTCEDTVFQELT